MTVRPTTRYTERIADWATLVLAGCGLVAVAVILRDRQGRATVPPEDRQVSGWASEARMGPSIGNVNAPVSIIEFMDYECPFCKQLEPTLRSLEAVYPTDVEFAVKQLPLAQHPHAYQASRLAVCAYEQGRFREAHIFLLDTRNLADLTPSGVANEIAVPDTTRFVQCANEQGEVETIDQDLDLARRWGVAKTPTLVVNGRLLAMTPDSARLFQLVKRELETRAGGRR